MTTTNYVLNYNYKTHKNELYRKAGEKLEDYSNMPMTAKEAARAMIWVKAQGMSDSKAIELINFITDTNVPEERTEVRETKE